MVDKRWGDLVLALKFELALAIRRHENHVTCQAIRSEKLNRRAFAFHSDSRVYDIARWEVVDPLQFPVVEALESITDFGRYGFGSEFKGIAASAVQICTR